MYGRLTAAALLGAAAMPGAAIRPGVAIPRDEGAPPRPSTADCTVEFIEQRLDHFSFAATSATFRQRYFVCRPPGGRHTK